MRYLLFDDENRANLLPLAYTRPIAEFRIGILTIAEKWNRRMPNEAVFGGYVTETYLQGKYPSDINEDQFWNLTILSAKKRMHIDEYALKVLSDHIAREMKKKSNQ